MKIENKWSDFSYCEPPVISQECMDDLMAIQNTKKDAIDLYKAWNWKYHKEVTEHRETVLGNVSNFFFMLSFIGTEKWPAAKRIAEGFIGKNGFFHLDGKWICNQVKALAMVETKTMQEAEPKPVYGGVYE